MERERKKSQNTTTKQREVQNDEAGAACLGWLLKLAGVVVSSAIPRRRGSKRQTCKEVKNADAERRQVLGLEGR
jgi:hypothetical protein